MARAQKDLLSRLADAGEEAIQRLGDAPGGDRVLGAVKSMRDRLDEMQKQLRGLATIEKRLAALERRVDALAAPRRRTTTKKTARPSTSTARRTTTRRKTT